MILAIDPERERISLGLKQMEQDPFSDYVAINDKGSIVTGTVKEVDAKQATIQLADEVEGILKASDLSIDHVSDARTALTVGDTIEVKIVNVDRKNRGLGVSVKAKDLADEQTAVKEHREREVAAVTPATLGDLIKQEQDKAATESE